MKNILYTLTGLMPLTCLAENSAVNEANEKNERPNVLFIVVDDLRPELGCYGVELIKSPNIDKLAAESYFFERSYCNIPVSGASRASIFTGVRSHKNTFLTAASWMDKDAKDAITLPELLRNSGYYTATESKVFHHATDKVSSWDYRYREQNDSKDPDAWKDYVLFKKKGIKGEKTPAYECADVDDQGYIDGRTAERAIKKLRELKQSGKPFFYGVGFLKPHLPFNAPKKYWDLYNPDEIKLPENYRTDFPGIPQCAFHNSGELRTYADIPKERLFDEKFAKNLIHGYYACVSYVDAQVGKVLDELKRLELDKNTIVILIGDHGWNLGDHAMWNKHCNFSTSIEAPLMIKLPGKKGKKVKSVVEFVDIYPTVCELCGIEKPENQLQGESLLPAMEKPDKIVQDYAISKFKNGLTLITPQYTYTEWLDANDNVRNRMLFDIKKDKYEDNNLSEKPEMASMVKEFSEMLRKERGY